jgi:hypothetical protein
MQEEKCISKSRTMRPCPFSTTNPNKLCKNHQYQSEYTPDMMENLKPCSTCHKTFYLPTGKICAGCKERSAKNNQIRKETVIKCEKEGCKFKRSKENKYCKLHQLQVFLDETKEANLKTCYNHIRGCKAQLPMEYTFSKCQDCLEKERIKDHKRRGTAIQESTAFIPNGEQITKKCTVCCIEKNANEFIGQHGLTKTCKQCRDSNKKQDANRDKERRLELSRIREQTLNIKYNRGMKDARHRGILFELTVEQYKDLLKNNCYYCGDVSVIENIEATDTDSEILYKFGIDRKDSAVGYIFENCVSCCSTCNYMKLSLSVFVFLRRVEHIVKYFDTDCVETKYPELFADYKITEKQYGNYKHSAKQRGYEFTLTVEEFENETDKCCYICGKASNETHMNGLDRFDNSIGYTVENVRSCCRECNFMKSTYSYHVFINKCRQIYNHQLMNTLPENIQVFIEELPPQNTMTTQHRQTLIHTTEVLLDQPEALSQNIIFTMIHDPSNEPINNCSVVQREISGKEMRKNASLRKQKQFEKLKILYGETEYKEMQAKKMAEYRKKKKERNEIPEITL